MNILFADTYVPHIGVCASCGWEGTKQEAVMVIEDYDDDYDHGVTGYTCPNCNTAGMSFTKFSPKQLERIKERDATAKLEIGKATYSFE